MKSFVRGRRSRPARRFFIGLRSLRSNRKSIDVGANRRWMPRRGNDRTRAYVIQNPSLITRKPMLRCVVHRGIPHHTNTDSMQNRTTPAESCAHREAGTFTSWVSVACLPPVLAHESDSRVRHCPDISHRFHWEPIPPESAGGLGGRARQRDRMVHERMRGDRAMYSSRHPGQRHFTFGAMSFAMRPRLRPATRRPIGLPSFPSHSSKSNQLLTG